MNKTTVIRLKSDNYDTYVSEDLYKIIILEMSTGDYHTHKTKRIELDADQLDHLKYHYKTGFVEIVGNEPDSEEMCLVIYDGQGDCYFEPWS